MPPSAVKTIQDLLFWQYSKIITESAGVGKRNYGFIMDRFKKLHRNQQEIIVREVENLRLHPSIGEDLVGVLKDYNSIEIPRIEGAFRLVYRVLNPEELIHLIAVGPHRTFYRESERYIKETKLYR